jgi:formate hydrogenlyase subunit 3/multisubunit Na+/H+ antiporter MnhD subunit
MQFVLFFGLPFPMFFGVLVNQKDTIDYMLPGIFGWGFDFGILGLIGLMVFVLGTILIGFKILNIYREKREKNNKKYLGREVLLTGALAAFCAQSLIGLFIFNRSINGMALLTFIFVGALILANVVTLKSRS